ncbi:MAG TPA: STAS domain-containing protein [Tepidisphaeraceae bacterium]|nr:STAS domain-containing protein [Tepidisphaeraceae bacterium]
MADLFRVELLGSVNVIELCLPESLDAVEFDRLNAAILGLLDAHQACPWVLDLSRVTYLGSAMLGLIVNVRQRVKLADGQLVLCGMSPRLLEIFRACSMERLFTIVRSRAEAIRIVAR